MKKSRLLEIIREEIVSTLQEVATIDTAKDPKRLTSDEKETAIKTARTSTKDTTIGTAKNPAEFIEEDLLMERPFIEGPLDFAYVNGKLEKRILGKAVTDAAKTIEKSFPNISPDSATQIIMGKKARTSEKTPEAIKTALLKVDDAIQAQLETFNDEDLLKDLLNKGEIGKDPKEIERINSYIEPDDKGNIKRYVEKLGGPQTLNAVEKILSGEESISIEPKTVEKPKAAEKALKASKEEPKKATLTKGDDGFDNVTYSKPKPAIAPKEKESPEKKANKAALANKGIDKKADRQSQLVKDKRAIEDKIRSLIPLAKEASDEKKRNELIKDLKQLNDEKKAIDKEIDRLFK